MDKGRCEFCRDFREKIEPYLCPECAMRIKELGYRKLPKDKPPLLKRNPVLTETGNMVAQREADIKWYEGN